MLRVTTLALAPEVSLHVLHSSVMRVVSLTEFVSMIRK